MNVRIAGIGVAIGLLAAIGCGTESIPRAAVAGTTITIPIPKAFAPGFGTRLSESGNIPNPGGPFPAYDAAKREDPQHGELVFVLNDGLGGETLLPLRHITRVAPHELSLAGLGDSQDSVADYRPGQVLAFVDIPSTVAAGDHTIEVERWRRTESDPQSFEKLVTEVETPAVEWLGWGQSDPSAGIPITVVAQPGGSTDDLSFFRSAPKGWTSWGGMYTSDFIQQNLEELVPYPSFDFFVPAPFQEEDTPAAWEAEFSYPRHIIQIHGVKLYRDNPSGAIVSWTADPPEDGSAVGCSAGSGTLKIAMADPQAKTTRVTIAYSLRNFDSCGRRAVLSDFAPVDFRAYDIDGNVQVVSSGGNVWSF